jgi:5-hydroxyisourate hydrolase
MITTHVLDLANGGPAPAVSVRLEFARGSQWIAVGRGVTDERGRLTTLSDGWAAAPGTYRLTFDLAAYQRARGVTRPFFPEAAVTFEIVDMTEHYHVPLLISPFGYTTYRGT